MCAHRGLGAFVAACLALAGCGSAATYVWVDQVPPAEVADPPGGEYRIASGDMLSIRVYNQDAISTRGRVHPDGRIAVPLAGEVQAEGRRPADLAKDLEAKLKPFVLAPVVTIGVEEVEPLRITVIGEVTHPGVYPLAPGAGVIDALATAGGMTDYADRDRIFVVRRRREGPPLRIRFSYALLSGGSRGAAGFALARGDTVTVE